MMGTWLRNTLPLKPPLKISLNLARAMVFCLFLWKPKAPPLSPTVARY